MERRVFFLLFVTAVGFLGDAIALTVTEPSSGTTWNLHSPNDVEWQSVSTDPESIEIRLVNNNPAAYGTGFTKTIKDGINTADNKYTIESIPGAKAGHGFQINIMSSAGTILAQSAQFSINGTASPNNTASPHISAPSAPAPNLAASAPTAAASSVATSLTMSESLSCAPAIALSTLFAIGFGMWSMS